MATVFLTMVSAVVTFYLDSIAGAWKLLLVTGAGTGSVLLLRWYWWRINAWSEVSAMMAAFVVSLALQVGLALDTDEPRRFRLDHDHHRGDHDRRLAGRDVPHARPSRATFWSRSTAGRGRLGRVGADRGARAGSEAVARRAVESAVTGPAGCMLIYGVLFGVGKLLLHETLRRA